LRQRGYVSNPPLQTWWRSLNHGLLPQVNTAEVSRVDVQDCEQWARAVTAGFAELDAPLEPLELRIYCRADFLARPPERSLIGAQDLKPIKDAAKADRFSWFPSTIPLTGGPTWIQTRCFWRLQSVPQSNWQRNRTQAYQWRSGWISKLHLERHTRTCN